MWETRAGTPVTESSGASVPSNERFAPRRLVVATRAGDAGIDGFDDVRVVAAEALEGFERASTDPSA